VADVVTVKGYGAGPRYNKGGSGSNFLCLPEDPQWKTFLDGYSSVAGEISGFSYEIFNSAVSYQNSPFSESNSDGPLAFRPAPCAVCYVASRSTVLMIPARIQCPDDWTMEYAGYLVSDFTQNSDKKRSSYICLDEAPEVADNKTVQGKWHGVIYPVEVTCGTVPCSSYINGRELACVVCSK